MQPLARRAPERIAGLFFFDFLYPGIGPRMAEPDRLNNIWYQSFNQLEIAPALVGASRESCRAYIGYFLKHWSYRKHAFDDVLEAFVDNFLKPGNLAGGFAYYRAAHAGRIRMLKGEAPQIGADRSCRPACAGPSMIRCFPMPGPIGSARRFSNLDLAMFGDVGHFAHREDPDRAASEIAAFFKRIGWGVKYGNENTGEKVGPPDATKHWRPRAASLKFWPGSAASPVSRSDELTVATRAETATRSGFNLTDQPYLARESINLHFSQSLLFFAFFSSFSLPLSFLRLVKRALPRPVPMVSTPHRSTSCMKGTSERPCTTPSLCISTAVS